MAFEEFGVRFVGDASKGIQAARDYTAALLKLDMVVTALEPKLARLGAATANITAATTRQTRYNTALGETAVQAVAAQAALGNLNATAATSTTRMNAATTSSQGLNSSFLGFSAGALAVMEVRKAIGALAEGLKEARDYANETAAANLKLRDLMREQANLSGKSTAQASAETISSMLKTGLSETDAEKHGVLFSSAISTAKKSPGFQLNAVEIEKLRIESGKFARMTGIDPGVIAQAVGGLAMSEPIKTADEALAKIATTHKFAQESPARLKQVYGMTQKLRSQMVKPGPGGAFETGEELMAVGAAMSSEFGGTDPTARAAVAIRNAAEGMSDFTGKRGATLKGLGITPDMDFKTKLRKMQPLIDKAGPNVTGTLKEAGFTNKLERQGIEAGVKKIDAIEADAKRALEQGDPVKLRAQIDKWYEENPMVMAAAQQRAAAFRTGEQRTAFQAAQAAQAARLEHRGIIRGPGNVGRRSMYDALTKMVPGALSAEDMMVNMSLQRGLLQADPNLAKQFPDLPGLTFKNPLTQQAQEARLAQIVSQVDPKTMAKVAADPSAAAAIDAMAKPAGRGAGFNPAAPAAAPVGPAAAAPAGPGPQASIDGSDLKNAAGALMQAADALKGAAGGGMADAGGRRDEFGSMPDYGPGVFDRGPQRTGSGVA
jgi:hypothetical protein